MNRKTAEKVLAEVKAKYAKIYGDGAYGEPTLQDSDGGWASEGNFAILWEEGPYEWAYGYRTKVAGTFVEPITSFILGVYDA